MCSNRLLTSVRSSRRLFREDSVAGGAVGEGLGGGVDVREAAVQDGTGVFSSAPEHRRNCSVKNHRPSGSMLPAEAGVPIGPPTLIGGGLHRALPKSRECAPLGARIEIS